MRAYNSHRVKKWAAISALALLLTLTLPGPAAVAQAAAFHANGAFAGASFCSESATSLECISVFVNRGSTAGQTATFLSYDHFILDLNTGAVRDTFGFGTIPNSAFQVQRKASALNVDTSKVVNFGNQLCTSDPNTNEFTCNSVPGGVVTGTWTLITPLVITKNTGTFSTSSPGIFRLMTTGTSESHPALANVNVLGTAAANVEASIGTQHNTSITIQH